MAWTVITGIYLLAIHNDIWIYDISMIFQYRNHRIPAGSMIFPWYFDISEIVGYLPHWMRYLHFACFDYQDLPEWRLIHVEFVQFHQNVIWSSEKWCWEFFRGGDPWRLIWEEEQKYLELSTEINYPSHSHEYFLFAKQWRLCIHYCAISLCLLEQPGNSLGTWHPLTMQ